MPTNADLVRALKSLPECRLELLDIAKSCVGSDGAIDLGKLTVSREYLSRATNEAERYANATEQLRQRVRTCLCTKDSTGH